MTKQTSKKQSFKRAKIYPKPTRLQIISSIIILLLMAMGVYVTLHYWQSGKCITIPVISNPHSFGNSYLTGKAKGDWHQVACMPGLAFGGHESQEMIWSWGNMVNAKDSMTLFLKSYRQGESLPKIPYAFLTVQDVKASQSLSEMEASYKPDEMGSMQKLTINGHTTLLFDHYMGPFPERGFLQAWYSRTAFVMHSGRMLQVSETITGSSQDSLAQLKNTYDDTVEQTLQSVHYR